MSNTNELINKLKEENKFYKTRYYKLYNKLQSLLNKESEYFKDNNKSIIKFGNEPIDLIELNKIEQCFNSGVKGDADLFEILHFCTSCCRNVKVKMDDTKTYFLIYDSIVWTKSDIDEITRTHLLWIGDLYKMFLLNKKGKGTITESDITRYRMVTQYEKTYKLELGELIFKILKKYKDFE